MGLVQIVAVLAFPAEGLALLDLKPARVDVLALEELYVFLGKVLADDGNEPDVGEITG